MSFDMMFQNAFFHQFDPHPAMLGDFEIPEGWWSRRYEYAWAMRYAKANQIVADMGCGWHYRPLHDALAMKCDFVYGVDHHVEVLELPAMQNGKFLVADFSERIESIPEASLNRIFCISVLEELINYQDALAEFKRLLKPSGLIILTCDMPFDPSKPEHDKYKGVKLEDLERAIQAVGLRFDGLVNRGLDMENALHNDTFNLCVWHCVLRHG